jgi:hypothetical protein
MYELLLTRIFSVLMWYHFASIAISLALFGGGAAAMTVCLLPRRFPRERLEHQITRLSVLFALAVALFFGLFVLFRLQPHLAFRILSFFHQPFYQPYRLNRDAIILLPSPFGRGYPRGRGSKTAQEDFT